MPAGKGTPSPSPAIMLMLLINVKTCASPVSKVRAKPVLPLHGGLIGASLQLTLSLLLQEDKTVNTTQLLEHIYDNWHNICTA